MSAKPEIIKNGYTPAGVETAVDWRPWGAAAIAEAKRLNRPLFLSIGDIADGACRAMLKGAFSDRRCGEFINSAFVPVMADRLERGDVEAAFMRACVLLNGAGALPLNVFATPEGLPFFAFSYLPADTEGSVTGLLPLLSAVKDRWDADEAALRKTAGDILSALESAAGASAAGSERHVEPESLVKAARDQLMEAFDTEFGGFGRGPKFPSPPALQFLQREAFLNNDAAAKDAVDLTLRQLYRGGIYDHIGGGFFSSSPDREMLRPVFEKTLSDNAQLAYLYAEAWQNGHMEYRRRAAEATLDFCLRELRTDTGYVSSIFDDSANGDYFLFSPAELGQVLGELEGSHFGECYDVDSEPNLGDKSIPNLLLNKRWAMLPEGYGDYCGKLLALRDGRPGRGIGGRASAASEGMLLSALALAGRLFNREDYLDEAEKLADRLKAAADRNEAPSLGELVFTAGGLLELYGADYDPEHLEAALSLCRRAAESCADPAGGYFDFAAPEDAPFIRVKSVFDGAAPCPNGAMAVLLSRLAAVTGDKSIVELASTQRLYVSATAGDYPAGSPCGVMAMFPLRALVCSSAGDVPETFKKLSAVYSPVMERLLLTPESLPRLSALCPVLSGCSGEGFFILEDGAVKPV